MRTRIGLAGAAVALVGILSSAPGALAADAVYGGTTSDGEAIVVTADKAGKKLRSAVIAWKADCGDQSYFSNGSSLTPTKASPGFSAGPDDLQVSRNGKRRFAGKQMAGYDLGESGAAVVVKLDGRLGAKAASGTLTATVAIIDKASGNQTGTCDTGRLRWKATRAPGRVYAGKTSQDQPVVVRVDAKRKRVTDVLVSWESSSCQPPGHVQFGESLSNFSLASTGRFADSWDDTQTLDDGVTVKVTYAVAGSIARRAARGTLRIGFALQDAAGTPMRSCDSGGVTWKATTG
jgi:hypothetical protein